MDDERLEREAAKILFSAPTQSEEELPHANPQGPEILFVCPFCNETYHVSAELVGKKINCRNCREACRVDTLPAVNQPRVGWYYCLGVVTGVVFSAIIVTALKLLRLL